ncbi:MAG: universal stress protein [Defluviitaleaceae bacterium]|nr:universal stress protein [Defluviitaleaceae bacterium]
MYKNILVAIDKGSLTESLREKAIQQALAFEAKLTLCHIKKNTVVYNSMISVGMFSTPRIIQDHSYSLDEALEAMKREALDAGVKEVEIVQTHSSSPSIATADVIASAYQADLIMCVRSDKTSLNRLLLGSFSSELINYAKCDVLVVRNKNE